MFTRPKPGEDEEDILRMQEQFLREKNKNQNLQPAAQVVNLRNTPSKRPGVSKSEERKPSKFAQNRGLKNHLEKRQKTENDGVVGEILEKNVVKSQEDQKSEEADDNVYFPKIFPSVLGNIVEKNVDQFVDINFDPMPVEGFPVAIKHINKEVLNEMDVDVPSGSNIYLHNNLPNKSYIVSSNEADAIHKENVEVLNKMSESEILEQQKSLLANIDPKIVEFLKTKRNQNKHTNKPVVDEKIIMETIGIENKTSIDDSLWENDILSHPNVDKWLHFDSLEKDKLEWMKGIEENKNIKPDESYEARFNFNGYLLPYSIEYNENTKTLFHHGNESHRPGYSLTEIFELSRSTVTQQRVVALNTVAGILEYYYAGTYKDILELPLSKILFVIRILLDENKVIILEPGLKAMRNLLVNRIDEASLDALLGFEEGNHQPCLENDKSEIDELESKESELKDYHLAEVDIVTAVLRTDILQRLYYILDTIKPTFNCVQYALQILTRLVRDSVDTATKIMEMEHLMNSVISNFLPITSINFAFRPEIVYSKPILAALKFIRVLSLQSKYISDLLVTKYSILKPISEYLASGVDGIYGLRIQIEVFSILNNLLQYQCGVDGIVSLMPIIVTTLYKHVQGTDVFVNSSVISAMHAAVVLQCINKLLMCNYVDIDKFKLQIYPLIKEGTQKWLMQLSQSDSYTCGHLKLICSVLDCCRSIILIENVAMPDLNNSLKVLSNSKTFNNIVKELIPSSNLLSALDNKNLHLVHNLKSLGSSIIDSTQKVLPLLNYKSPIPFLGALFNLLLVVKDKGIANMYISNVQLYLNEFAKKMPSLCDNWFTRIETDLLLSILKVSVNNDFDEIKKDGIYVIANKLCYILRIDKIIELQWLFKNMIFNKDWFTAQRLLNMVSISDSEVEFSRLSDIEDILNCYAKVINFGYNDTGPNVILRKWQEPILPRDWIYLPILSLYSKSQEVETAPKVIGPHASKVAQQIAVAKAKIISSSLEWILFNELCFPDLLTDITATDRFCRIMCVFLCDNSLFLDPQIKVLLRQCLKILFKKRNSFDFDKDLTGLHNFQDFYTQFLEQFQSVSYGDFNFAACVLVPLVQRHNVKWRKLVWSEYAGCLRALDCPEEYLCYTMEEYLNPLETDDSLIKSYFQALSSSLLRPDTVAFRIARHHAEHYKMSKALNA